ncbi:Na(+)-translocating NADH-quinone reductase subunit A [Porphyromonadaceae bacterium W3.11]|nr:Na(+)-translocating NADH-quinone reductase subunit A [Porphyromonadaceae bacterium W3.11]
MANVIKTKKGLDINLVGEAPKVEVLASPVRSYGVVPDHFSGIIPRLSVKEGDHVQAGDAVIYHKNEPMLKLTAPVSGEIVEVKRGAKRKILYVQIKPESTIDYKEFDVANAKMKSREDILNLLGESGLLALFRNRPYDMIVDPKVTPRDIYVTGYLSAPLMPDVISLVKDDLKYLQNAIDVIGKLTKGDVYMGVKKGTPLEVKNCKVYEIDGPHPAGNASVFINHTKPLNRGENVWAIGLTELALIGRFLATGRVDMSRKVVFAGSCFESAGYATVRSGSEVNDLTAGKIEDGKRSVRIIDGDVLTGTKLTEDYRYMSPFSNIISAIPEGDDVNELFGWAALGMKKYSVNRSYPTFLFGKSRKYDIDARLKGGTRAIIVSNEYDKVFPLDIYPEQLVKATIAFNIDKMEELGIYEVAPEDFALCEFVDTSKLELQYIIRKGLDELYKEMN